MYLIPKPALSADGDRVEYLFKVGAVCGGGILARDVVDGVKAFLVLEHHQVAHLYQLLVLDPVLKADAVCLFAADLGAELGDALIVEQIAAHT